MHELAPIIRDLAIILGIGSIVMLCCRQLKQPLVLGYLIAGMIIGPYTPPYMLVSDIPGIKVVAEMGVIFLMFSIGLDFSFHKLKRIGQPALTTGFFEVLVMLVVGYILGRAIGWNSSESLFLGAALSISSTTIIVKALDELKLKRAAFAELVIGVLVVEDLLAILMLVGLPLLAVHTTAFDGTILHAVIKLILVISSWFLIGYFVVPTIFRKWIKEASDEVLIVVSVALCFAMVCLATSSGYSGALGAFIMGSILAETQESKRIEKLVEPLRDVYAAVFFVAIGMLISPEQIWQHFGLVLIITAVTIIGKMAVSFVGAYFSTGRLSLASQVGFSMAQIGEFSFIITALGVALNLLSQQFYAIIVAVSLLTTFTTPYFIRISMRLAEYLKTKEKHLEEDSHRKRHTKLGKFRMTLRESLFTYIVNMILVAIIFSIMNTIERDSVRQFLLIDNIIFGISYLFAAPFIAMLLIIPFKGTSLIFKILGLTIALLEIGLFVFKHFNHLGSFIIWYLVILILSLSLHKMWSKVYAWLAAHLHANLKKEV